MRRRRKSPILGFSADPGKQRWLYLQIRDFLREAMLRGEWHAGASLPSTRVLAKQLGVSRNSVLRAYEALAAEGLLQGRVGSGTRVTVGGKRPKPRDLQFLLRNSHFPIDAVPLRDPDGNPLYLHR